MRKAINVSNKFYIGITIFLFLIIIIMAVFAGINESNGVMIGETITKNGKNYNKNADKIEYFAQNHVNGDCGIKCYNNGSNFNTETAECLIEKNSGRILFSMNASSKMYPASTTKIVTALAVIQNCDINKTVTVDDSAVGVEGSSIYLKTDEKIKIYDLLCGLMMRSGNDSAIALAIAVSGSVEKFAELLNDTAKKCGAKDSNFVNPHGLHNENHYTTALDLAYITASAYNNSVFCQIVSQKSHTFDRFGKPCVFYNKNKMLNLFSGANGVKTGYTKNSGRCLVSGAERENMQLISVVLNCSDMWNRSISLLKTGFDDFEMIDIELALTNNQASKTIEIDSDLDELLKLGTYPLKRDKSERLVLV